MKNETIMVELQTIDGKRVRLVEITDDLCWPDIIVWESRAFGTNSIKSKNDKYWLARELSVLFVDQLG